MLNAAWHDYSCFRANSKISELQRSKAAEIAKLTALLRKSEMRIASLERSVDQKVIILIGFIGHSINPNNFRLVKIRN